MNKATDQSIRDRALRQAEASKQAARDAAEAQKRWDRISAARNRAQAAQAARVQTAQPAKKTTTGRQTTKADRITQPAYQTPQTRAAPARTSLLGARTLIGAWGCGDMSCTICYRQA